MRQILQRQTDLLFQRQTVDAQLRIRLPLGGHHDRVPVDRDGQHPAVVVVSVVTHQIHATGRDRMPLRYPAINPLACLRCGSEQGRQ